MLSINTKIGTINTKIGTINTKIGTINTVFGTMVFVNFLQTKPFPEKGFQNRSLPPHTQANAINFLP
jgi:hypothetical protein